MSMHFSKQTNQKSLTRIGLVNKDGLIMAGDPSVKNCIRDKIQ